VFDIEMAEKNFGELVEHIAAPEPTFRGANIEDIKPPDCFYVERALRARMKIPGCPRRRCVSLTTGPLPVQVSTTQTRPCETCATLIVSLHRPWRTRFAEVPCR
jgi:hypothetical protein